MQEWKLAQVKEVIVIAPRALADTTSTSNHLMIKQSLQAIEKYWTVATYYIQISKEFLSMDKQIGWYFKCLKVGELLREYA
jgi:hypothetical protein